MYSLAEALGESSPNRMLRNMPSSELTEWMAYFEVKAHKMKQARIANGLSS